MRIGIDARSLVSQKAGIGKVVFNLLTNIEKIDKINKYYLYSNHNFDLSFSNRNWYQRVGTDLFSKSGSLWLMTSARKIMVRDGIDVFWGQEIIPYNFKIRKILTIHDLVWHYYPSTMSSYNALVHRLFQRLSIMNADTICCVSNAVAEEVRNVYGVNGDRIRVIYSAADLSFYSDNKAEAAEYVSRKFNTSLRFILNVGTVEPRKNKINLLRAMRYLFDELDLKCQLLIAGAKGWKNSELYQEYRKLNFTEQEIKFLGYVTDKDILKLYNAAQMFVFPSLYEGFGLPVLEAMACGCPVVISDIPSLSEISSDAAIKTDPHNYKNLAGTIKRVLLDEQLSKRLIGRGLERVKEFSWEKAAKQMLAVLLNK